MSGIIGKTAKDYIKLHPIEGMFFSEFHHKLGPKITYQYPEGCIPNQSKLCRAVMNYLIPKPELQQKLITINIIKKKVIGCPVCIVDRHYPRNEYIFNFGLIIDAEHRSSPCVPLIRKLSCYMIELEKESYYVSNEETKALIPDMLKRMLIELNENGSCITSVTEATTLYLKIFPPFQLPPDVLDYNVPILIISKEDFDLKEWDLTSQRILPYIDGFHHVKKIATLADVDLELTRVCMRDLCLFGIIKLISIFQYCNTYTTEENLANLMKNEKLQQDCLCYVARTGRPKPTVRDVLTLFAGLAPDVTVRDLCSRYQEQITRINEQKLIQFGLLNHLIRRIHQYPVLISTSQNIPIELRKLLTDNLHTDDICCRLSISTEELLSKLESDPNIVFCRK